MWTGWSAAAAAWGSSSGRTPALGCCSAPTATIAQESELVEHHLISAIVWRIYTLEDRLHVFFVTYNLALLSRRSSSTGQTAEHQHYNYETNEWMNRKRTKDNLSKFRSLIQFSKQLILIVIRTKKPSFSSTASKAEHCNLPGGTLWASRPPVRGHQPQWRRWEPRACPTVGWWAAASLGIGGRSLLFLHKKQIVFL